MRITDRGNVAFESESIDSMLPNLRVELRPYQQTLIRQAIPILASNVVANRSLLIECPTGGGKTLIGLWLASFLQNHMGFRVGWMAGRERTMRDTRAENARRHFNVRLVEVSANAHNMARINEIPDKSGASTRGRHNFRVF